MRVCRPCHAHGSTDHHSALQSGVTWCLQVTAVWSLVRTAQKGWGWEDLPAGQSVPFAGQSVPLVLCRQRLSVSMPYRYHCLSSAWNCSTVTCARYATVCCASASVISNADNAPQSVALTLMWTAAKLHASPLERVHLLLPFFWVPPKLSLVPVASDPLPWCA